MLLHTDAKKCQRTHSIKLLVNTWPTDEVELLLKSLVFLQAEACHKSGSDLNLFQCLHESIDCWWDGDPQSTPRQVWCYFVHVEWLQMMLPTKMMTAMAPLLHSPEGVFLGRSMELFWHQSSTIKHVVAHLKPFLGNWCHLSWACHLLLCQQLNFWCFFLVCIGVLRPQISRTCSRPEL